MTSYFNYFSFARAKQNKEALEKTNPKTPVLNDDDEQFLHKITSSEAAAPPLPPAVVSTKAQETESGAQETALPSSPPATEPDKGLPETSEQVPAAKEEQSGAPEAESMAGKPAESEKLPADNKAEGETAVAELRAEDEKTATKDKVEEEKTTTEGKTEDEPTPADSESIETTSEPTEESAATGAETSAEGQSTKADDKEVAEADTGSSTSKRTWASYVPSIPAIPAIPAMPAMPAIHVPSLPTWNTKGKDRDTSTTSEDVVIKNEDGTINEEASKAATADKDEQEVSVLLDKLNLSSINNRVFAFSEKSQQIYSEFTVVLKDIVIGGPTAYQDMEKLLKENEGHLGEMFKNMPPFVQTLVKSLPAKLGSTLGPEMFAAASNKPGADMRSKMASASKTEEAVEPGPSGLTSTKKQKRKVPNVKSLVTEQGAATSMLKSIVSFLQARFPAFVTGTNVIMSLAVFILLFVFWYCHKRGKEVRLLKAAEEEHGSVEASDVSDMEDSEISEKEEEQGEEAAAGPEEEEEEEEGAETKKELEASVSKPVSEAPKTDAEPATVSTSEKQ